MAVVVVAYKMLVVVVAYRMLVVVDIEVMMQDI
jgi:hypothetical protein